MNDETKDMPEQPNKVYKLDIEDTLRLKNMMLVQEVAKLSIALTENDAKEDKDVFKNHLIKKLNVDTRTHHLEINIVDNTVMIIPNS